MSSFYNLYKDIFKCKEMNNTISKYREEQRKKYNYGGLYTKNTKQPPIDDDKLERIEELEKQVKMLKELLNNSKNKDSVVQDNDYSNRLKSIKANLERLSNE